MRGSKLRETAVRVLGAYRILASLIRSLDKRYKFMVAILGVYQWVFNLPTNYNQLYITGLGADTVKLGSLSSLGGLVSSTASAPVGWLIDKYGVKRMVVYGLLISTLVSLIYYTSGSWLSLIPAVMLAELGFRMIIPLTDLIFMDVVKSTSRAQAVALSRTVWAIPSLAAPMTAAFIVASSGGICVEGIRPLYILQAAATALVALLVYLKLKETHVNSMSLTSGVNFMEGFREVLRGGRRILLWLITMGLWRFSSSISMPYIPLWMAYVKGADPYILGIVGTAGLVSSALLQMPIGILADRIGRKKAFLISRPIAYLGTAVLLLAPYPQLLAAVGFLGAIGFMGGFAVVSFTPFVTMHWEMVPAEMRGRWFGLSSLFESMAIAGYMLGGILWSYGYMELVLLLPVIVEVTCIMPILISIPDTLEKNQE
ncbi:MFS transporter [Candidatus Bathyarchaeota archaeon]|nr:MFS transporter [Candidatus Bathyarchaeota archaeon]